MCIEDQVNKKIKQRFIEGMLSLYCHFEDYVIKIHLNTLIITVMEII